MSKTKLAHGTKAYVTNKAKDASAAPKHITKLGARMQPVHFTKAQLRKLNKEFKLKYPDVPGKGKLLKSMKPALDTLDAIPPATPKQVRDAGLYDWRDPIMYNLQTDLAVQRKIIDERNAEIALLRTELQHKNIFIDLLLKERDKS